MKVDNIRKMVVQHLASMSEAGYRCSRNPGHVWRTYRDYRDIGEPVPSWVLEALDVMAARVLPVLDAGGSNSDFVEALGFASRGGGPGIPKRLELEDRKLQAFYEISALLLVFANQPPDQPHTLKDICDDVANRHKVSSETVQNWYYELKKMLTDLEPVD